MKNLTEQILDLLENYSDEEARLALAEVVREFDLDVAANLIEQNVEPLALTKWSLEEDFYSEGNDKAGHLPLARILETFEEVINTDKSEKLNIKLEEHPVRPYTEEEIKEEGLSDGILWHKLDESLNLKKINIGFEAM